MNSQFLILCRNLRHKTNTSAYKLPKLLAAGISYTSFDASKA